MENKNNCDSCQYFQTGDAQITPETLTFLSSPWFNMVNDDFLCRYVRHSIEEWAKARQEMVACCERWDSLGDKEQMNAEQLYDHFFQLTELDREIENYKLVCDKILMECIKRGLDKTLLPLYGIHGLKFM